MRNENKRPASGELAGDTGISAGVSSNKCTTPPPVRQPPAPRGFRSPNYTQVPNDLLGHVHKGERNTPGLMANMGEAELRVVLALVRLTFGFHMDTTRASLTRLQKLTGLSRQGVVDGAAAAVARGLFTKDTTSGVTIWRLVIAEDEPPPLEVVDADQSTDGVVNVVDQATDGVVNVVDQGSQRSRPPSIKETKKERGSPTAGAVGASAPTLPPSQPAGKTRRPKAVPPAVQIFQSKVRRLPAKSWWVEIQEMVGDTPESLERWGAVVYAWLGQGWNPGNVAGMLDHFRRGEIPGEKHAAQRAGEPKGFEGIRRWLETEGVEGGSG